MKTKSAFITKVLLVLIPLVILSSCERNSTELIVESDTDQYTIQEVYMRKAGTLNYKMVWSANNSGIKWTHANISCDPGSYHVYVKIALLRFNYNIRNFNFLCNNFGRGV